LLLTSRPPASTLFPYTTLFRSTRSTTRVLNSSGEVSRRKRFSGKSGVRLSKWVLSFALSGSSPSTASTFSNAKKRSLSFGGRIRSEEHTSELQSRENLVCRLLL